MRTLVAGFLLVPCLLANTNAMERRNSIQYPSMLEPLVSPHLSGEDPYWNALNALLLTTPANFGRMLFKPALQEEFSVSVYKVQDEYFISASEAETSIYFSRQEAKQAPEVSSWTRQISPELAFAVRDTWQQMISMSQEHDHSYRGLDGYTVMFSVEMPDGAEQWAMTWSPKTESLQLLVEIGFALGYLAAETETESRKTPEEIIRMCHQLNKIIKR